MSPLRWDVLLVGFVLAVPVFALGLRGDLTAEDMMIRVVWCLAAGWLVVAVFHLATTPLRPAGRSRPGPLRAAEPGESVDASPAV